MQINNQQIISKARYLQQVDQTHTLKYYIIGESLKLSFETIFNKTFPKYTPFNSIPEIIGFTTNDVITGEIGIKNMFYGDFDENEYEIYGLMRSAENWVNTNIDALMAQAESEDLMHLVDDLATPGEEYLVSL